MDSYYDANTSAFTQRIPMALDPNRSILASSPARASPQPKRKSKQSLNKTSTKPGGGGSRQPHPLANDTTDVFQDSEDDADDEDRPKVTFIPHAKLRGTGGIAYQDERLHVNTMLFLKDLKANNKRSWLKSVPFWSQSRQEVLAHHH